MGRLLGHTPLLALDFRYRGEPRRIHAKAERFNFTGRIKDRMAFHILRTAYESGALVPGAPIAEATSGNTGISFSALGRAIGVCPACVAGRAGACGCSADQVPAGRAEVLSTRA